MCQSFKRNEPYDVCGNVEVEQVVLRISDKCIKARKCVNAIYKVDEAVLIQCNSTFQTHVKMR